MANHFTKKAESGATLCDEGMQTTGPATYHLNRIFNEWGDMDRSSGTIPVIGMLPGEGIGSELIGVCTNLLKNISACSDYCFDIRTGGLIGAPAWRTTGNYLNPEIEIFCREIHTAGGAVLCGPGGGRFVYDLRTCLDLFCKLTPLKPMQAIQDIGPLRSEATRGVDILLVRENIGGLYQGNHQRCEQEGKVVVHHHFEYSSEQVRRILEVGHKLAQGRSRRLCVIYKPGGVPGISHLWQEQAETLCEGGDVELIMLEIDNACYQLVANGRGFDVVVASNMFGDVLADAASVLLGSRGLYYSANFSDDGIGIYQTGHGAAYNLSGTDQANPLAQILSMNLMLAEHFGLIGLAQIIESAIEEILSSGWRTADIMASGCHQVGTQRMGELVSDTVCRLLSVA